MSFVLSKLGWALVRPGNLLAMMLILGQDAPGIPPAEGRAALANVCLRPACSWWRH